MRKRVWTLGLLSACLILPLTAGNITITVIPALAPNVYGSPSFAGWQDNAIHALENGLTSYGTAGTPQYYQAGSDYSTAQVVVTNFPSWMGVADPAFAFGPLYGSEYGNRMHFGFVAVDNGGTFSISQLSFTASSTDPYNGLAFSYLGGFNYSAGYVGLNYGPDGIKGTGDDIWITSGLDTQLVNELYSRGPGSSFEADCNPCTTTAQQAAIDDVATYGPFQFTATFSIGDATGSGTFDINTPEPGSIFLLGAGLALLTAAHWRKSRAA